MTKSKPLRRLLCSSCAKKQGERVRWTITWTGSCSSCGKLTKMMTVPR